MRKTRILRNPKVLHLIQRPCAPPEHDIRIMGGSNAIKKSVVIGIAGASCAGKTILAEAVAARLPDAIVLPVDAYYGDLAHLTVEQRAAVNFDEPAAIDHQLLESQLRDLRDMRPIGRPVYDFKTHTRCAQTKNVRPASFIIVEGLLALYWPELRELMDAAVFIGAPEAECLVRRTTRDVRDRGRTPESVRSQFGLSVRPMFEKWCVQTQYHADLVLDGLAPIDTLADRVIELLREKTLLKTI